MIRTLQRRFIFTAMVAITVLLVVLIGGINIADIIIEKRQIYDRLDMLIENERRMAETGSVPPSDAERGNRGRGNLLNPPIDEDTALSLRFFVIRLNEENQIVYCNLDRIASVDEDTAESFVETILEQQKTSGSLKGFQYRTIQIDGRDSKSGNTDTLILFLDTSSQRHNIFLVAVLSVSVAVLCWLLMLVLVILLSRRAIRPIAENMEKQKHFVTDAGHEIKTPLAIIMANLDAMELIAGENKWSKNIRLQAQRLNGLMQNLLTLARMEETSLELAMEDIKVSELVVETLQTFQESAALKSVQITYGIQPYILVKANREQIHRVISILLDNAVKYVEEKGKIDVSLEKREKTMILEVRNTCHEFPNDAPEQLFDRFYRGDSARTQKSGGYGIGLSAAKAIVEAHKGKIQAKYEEEHTIAFIVKLPVA